MWSSIKSLFGAGRTSDETRDESPDAETRRAVARGALLNASATSRPETLHGDASRFYLDDSSRRAGVALHEKLKDARDSVARAQNGQSADLTRKPADSPQNEQFAISESFWNGFAARDMRTGKRTAEDQPPGEPSSKKAAIPLTVTDDSESISKTDSLDAAQIRHLELRAEQARVAASLAKSRVAALEKARAELLERLDTVSAEAAKKERNARKLEANAKKQLGKVKELRERTEAAERKLAEIGSQVEAQTAEFSALQASFAEASVHVAFTEASLEAAKDRIRVLEAELANAPSTTDALQKMLRKAETDLELAMTRSARLEAEWAARLSREQESALAERTVAQSAIADLKTKYKSARDDAARILAREAQTRRERAEMKAKLARAKARIAELEQTKARMSSALTPFLNEFSQDSAISLGDETDGVSPMRVGTPSHPPPETSSGTSSGSPTSIIRAAQLGLRSTAPTTDPSPDSAKERAQQPNGARSSSSNASSRTPTSSKAKFPLPDPSERVNPSTIILEHAKAAWGDDLASFQLRSSRIRGTGNSLFSNISKKFLEPRNLFDGSVKVPRGLVEEFVNFAKGEIPDLWPGEDGEASTKRSIPVKLNLRESSSATLVEPESPVNSLPLGRPAAGPSAPAIKFPDNLQSVDPNWSPLTLPFGTLVLAKDDQFEDFYPYRVLWYVPASVTSRKAPPQGDDPRPETVGTMVALHPLGFHADSMCWLFLDEEGKTAIAPLGSKAVDLKFTMDEKPVEKTWFKLPETEHEAAWYLSRLPKEWGVDVAGLSELLSAPNRVWMRSRWKFPAKYGRIVQDQKIKPLVDKPGARSRVSSGVKAEREDGSTPTTGEADGWAPETVEADRVNQAADTREGETVGTSMEM